MSVRVHGFELQQVTIHDHDVAFRTAGSGPVLLLVHGMASSSATWLPVLPALAEHFTVVAPDLLGHGGSAKPRGDYSLGVFASGLRDLLVVLGHDRVTPVGRSFGGGVVMQFAYQFPEWCERLVLVSSGGLGNEGPPGRLVTLCSAVRELQGSNWGMRSRLAIALLLATATTTAGCGSTSTSTSKPTTTAVGTTSAAATTASTTAGSTTTAPATAATDSAVWPFVTSTTRYSDPVKAATDFAVTYLGFVNPAVGPFMGGDSRSGEVEIRGNKQGTAAMTVMVRKLAPDDSWWVIGAATTHLQLDTPVWNASITSPVTLSGQSDAYEATVNVEIRQDGSLTPLGTDFVMGGANGTMGPFSKAVTFTKPTAKRGAIVFTMPSSDGGGTLEAGVIRVQFP